MCTCTTEAYFLAIVELYNPIWIITYRKSQFLTNLMLFSLCSYAHCWWLSTPRNTYAMGLGPIFSPMGYPGLCSSQLLSLWLNKMSFWSPFAPKKKMLCSTSSIETIHTVVVNFLRTLCGPAYALQVYWITNLSAILIFLIYIFCYIWFHLGSFDLNDN